jgi:hypothetical protein
VGCGDKLRLLDQAILQGDRAEEQMAVGGQGRTSRDRVAAYIGSHPFVARHGRSHLLHHVGLCRDGQSHSPTTSDSAFLIKKGSEFSISPTRRQPEKPVIPAEAEQGLVGFPGSKFAGSSIIMERGPALGGRGAHNHISDQLRDRHDHAQQHDLRSRPNPPDSRRPDRRANGPGEACETRETNPFSSGRVADDCHGAGGGV